MKQFTLMAMMLSMAGISYAQEEPAATGSAELNYPFSYDQAPIDETFEIEVDTNTLVVTHRDGTTKRITRENEADYLGYYSLEIARIAAEIAVTPFDLFNDYHIYQMVEREETILPDLTISVYADAITPNLNGLVQDDCPVYELVNGTLACSPLRTKTVTTTERVDVTEPEVFCQAVDFSYSIPGEPYDITAWQNAGETVQANYVVVRDENGNFARIDVESEVYRLAGDLSPAQSMIAGVLLAAEKTRLNKYRSYWMNNCR